ncbi:hypothetical protein MIR68_010451 [Amoeboaphelidium protococcarum]|nr:hypothetical protein MIR68_010451 [Amoeboaphelidium protococcarum]
MILATVVVQDPGWQFAFWRGRSAIQRGLQRFLFTSGYEIMLVGTPSTVSTDGDLAFANGLDSIYGVNHYLCMFHLKQNLARNCRKLVANYDAFEQEFIRLTSIRDVTLHLSLHVSCVS